MNYAYLLTIEPSEEAIYKVVSETNLTVMYNTEENAYYLALCGGGMDLSQDIALAYFYAQRWIPYSLIKNPTLKDGVFPISINKQEGIHPHPQRMGISSTRILMEVCKQPELSVGGSKWLMLAREVRRQLRHYELTAKELRKEWLNSIKSYKRKSQKEQ
jgi:hypothetical protein